VPLLLLSLQLHGCQGKAPWTWLLLLLLLLLLLPCWGEAALMWLLLTLRVQCWQAQVP
jgi:hypothetical protein